MSIAIILRSYEGDFNWLHYSARSITKYVTGVDEKILITPVGQAPDAETLSHFDRHIQTVEDCHGYIAQQIGKMTAWQYTDCEHLLYTDSDCPYTQPFDARSRITDDGRVVLWRSPWNEVAEWGWFWRDVIERYTGIRPDWEYMRRQPIMHRAATVKAMTEHWPHLLTDCKTITNGEFSEFNFMGLYADLYDSQHYHFRQDAPETPCAQYWSHGGLTPEIREELERG